MAAPNKKMKVDSSESEVRVVRNGKSCHANYEFPGLSTFPEVDNNSATSTLKRTHSLNSFSSCLSSLNENDLTYFPPSFEMKIPT